MDSNNDLVTETSLPVATATAPPAAQPNTYAKRKVALFAAYVGAGYSGMQYNPGQQTIESELMYAIARAGGISSDNEGHFTKVGWARAARTDRGVSAVGQVVALKMILLDELLEKINTHLPSQIRALGYSRVTGGFDPRKWCDRRHYEYILPAWALDPTACLPAALQNGSTAVTLQQPLSEQPNQVGTDSNLQKPASTATGMSGQALSSEHTAAAAATLSAPEEPAGAANNFSEAASSLQSPHTPPSAALAEPDLDPQISGRATSAFDDACRARLDAVLSQYVGTHNFHNFTTKVAATDPSAKRFIRSFCCDTMQLQGQTWVRMNIIGQSFMLHQIRKMVGLAVAMVRGAAGSYVLPAALSPGNTVHVPMAPEGGLFLERCVFEAYNARWGHEHDRLDLDHYSQQVSSFKDNKLYPHIAEDVSYRQQLQAFLRSLTEASFKFAQWRDAATAPAGGKSKTAASLDVPIQNGHASTSGRDINQFATTRATSTKEQQTNKRPAAADVDACLPKHLKTEVALTFKPEVNASLQAEYSE